MPSTTQTRTHDLRLIALPAEHGGWGFLFEPILLGLMVAPTFAGLCLSIAAIAGFLIHQPVKYWLLARRRGVRGQRMALAVKVALLYGTVALAGFAATLWMAPWVFLAPLALALPFVAIYLFYDLTGPARTIQAELAAPVALGSVAASIALIDGWGWTAALALWVALAARGLPSVLYVRARIRLDKGRDVGLAVPIGAHVLALLVIAWLAMLGWLPFLAILPYLILLARAGLFLAPNRPRWPIKKIGFLELGLGLMTVGFIAVGYWQFAGG
ncbi:MAG: YwiC-like family protein [Caldilineaceae bacterium]|nr:YwiC-like family protein [Caldilineaceae bacterium]